MQYSVVKFDKVQSHKELRLEAEYYSPRFLELEEKLNKLGAYEFGQYVDDIKCGPFGSTILCDTYDTDGVIVARPFNIKEYNLENDNLAYITEQDCVDKGLDFYKTGDIFFSRVGDVRCGVVPPLQNKITISPNIIAVKTNKNKLNPYYATIFFNTKYGFTQLVRNMKVVAQPTIPTDVIKSLRICLFQNGLQEKIECIFQKYFILKNICQKKNTESEKLFLQELGIENFQYSQRKFYVKNFSDIQAVNRLDAEYFQPKYDEILEIINKNNHTALIEQFDIIRNSGLEYDSEGKNGVIKTKQIKDRFIDFNVEDRTNQGDSNVIVKNQDVLFASMGVGSLGKANIYYDFENNDKYIIDSTLKIFRAKTGSTLSPEYLDVYLHSQLAQELIYQNIVGSSGIISIYETYLQSLPIPIINGDAEEQIIENVNKAHRLNYQSKQLLEIAKHGVEKAIEENEDIAMQWIDEQLKQIGVTL